MYRTILFIIHTVNINNVYRNSIISSCFGISACVHSAWTIEEHLIDERNISKKLDFNPEEAIGYKGLWQECFWNETYYIYTCTSYISEGKKGCFYYVISE